MRDAFILELYSMCIHVIQFYLFFFLSHLYNDGLDWALMNIKQSYWIWNKSFLPSFRFLLKTEPSQNDWTKSNQKASQKTYASRWKNCTNKQTSGN